MVFSPSGDRLAYVAVSDSFYEISVDGDLCPLQGSLPHGSKPTWIDDHHVQILSEKHQTVLIETFET
jgi:hypothetical protein